MTDVKADPRASRREERKRHLKMITETGKPPAVKLWPATEAVRQSLRHPSGVRFRDKLDQPVEWPNDSFTARRIEDGSVRTDGAASSEEHKVDETLNAREQAEALKAKAKPQEKSEPEHKSHRSHREPQPQSQAG